MDAKNCYVPEPCANCGKQYGGVMHSTSWGHGYACCSKRCGERLAKRIENEMFSTNETNLYDMFSLSPTEDPRIQSMRNRIKQLEHQLRNHGIKSHSGKWKFDEVGDE